MNAVALALIDPVFELVSELRKECDQKRRANDGLAVEDLWHARARVLAIAGEVLGFEYEDLWEWYAATVALAWEGNAARARGELQQFLDEVEIARDRFDDEWDRLCTSPADDAETEYEED